MNLYDNKKNYKAMVAVTLLAIFLWFMVKMSKKYDYAIDVPLRIVNSSPEYCLKYPVPDTVKVEFTGTGDALFRLQFYPVVYQIDLSDVKDRIVMDITQHPEYVRFPEDLTVMVKSIIRPQQIVFEMDRCQEKRVTVRPVYQVKTEPGFTLVAVELKPDTVRVRGPSSYVDTLRWVYTARVVENDARLSFTRNVSIQKSGQFLAEYDPERVDIHFDIQRLAEKEITNVPVEVIHVPSWLEVIPLPSFVTLYIKGGEKILANARARDFRVIIDFRRDWKGEGVKIPARIETDLNILYVESRPTQFELFVQRK